MGTRTWGRKKLKLVDMRAKKFRNREKENERRQRNGGDKKKRRKK